MHYEEDHKTLLLKYEFKCGYSDCETTWKKTEAQTKAMSKEMSGAIGRHYRDRHRKHNHY